jgi:hypothetical protein
MNPKLNKTDGDNPLEVAASYGDALPEALAKIASGKAQNFFKNFGQKPAQYQSFNVMDRLKMQKVRSRRNPVA